MEAQRAVITWGWLVLCCVMAFHYQCGFPASEPAQDSSWFEPQESSKTESLHLSESWKYDGDLPSESSIQDLVGSEKLPDSSPSQDQEDRDIPESPSVEALPESWNSSSWLKAFGEGADTLSGTQIAVDPQGYIVVAGQFRGKMRVGNLILQAPNDWDAVLFRLSPSGDVLWVLHLRGEGIQEIRDVVVDKSGQITITGNFTKELLFSTTTWTIAQGGCFLLRLRPSGEVLWAKQVGGYGADLGQALVLDKQGHVYVFGSFSGPARFGSFSVSESRLYDLFVAKINEQGQFLWLSTTKGVVTSTANDIAIDEQGSLYIAGQYVAEIQIGSITLRSQQMDMFVAKMDNQGQFLWAISSAGDGLAVPHRLVSDPQGNLFLSGELEGQKIFGSFTLQQPRHGDIFVARLSSQGQFVWVKQNAGSSGVHIHPYAMFLSEQGVLFIAGDYTGTPAFDGHTLPFADSTQAFLLALDTKGSLMWLQTSHPSPSMHIRNLFVDAKQNLYLVGEFDTFASWGGLSLKPGSSQLYGFVGKYGRGQP